MFVMEQLTLFEVPSVAPHGWLYAVLMPSRAIKIGWTGRAPSVRARELSGQLLATTPGTLDDEHALHVMLDDHRIGRTEDFWPAPRVWDVVHGMEQADAA